jgi:hypothetical protein
MAKTAQTGMPMHNLNPLSYHNIPEDWEKGEDRGKGRRPIYDQKRYMIDFEAIRKVSDPSSSIIGMCYDDDLMPSVYELGRELVDVTFDSSWLRKEEVANHGNIVRHLDKVAILCPFAARREQTYATGSLSYSIVDVSQLRTSLCVLRKAGDATGAIFGARLKISGDQRQNNYLSRKSYWRTSTTTRQQWLHRSIQDMYPRRRSKGLK